MKTNEALHIKKIPKNQIHVLVCKGSKFKVSDPDFKDEGDFTLLNPVKL